MTRYFCDRCGDEIKRIATEREAYMSIGTRVAGHSEHESLLCERCAQEFKRWYLGGEEIMGANRVSDAANQKIITLMSVGKTAIKAAEMAGVSDTYCNKLWAVFNIVANEQWDNLIKYARGCTIGGVLSWTCDYLGTQLPQDVADTIKATKYRWTPKTKEEATHEATDNAAAAIIKLLEKLDTATAAITAAADDICQTMSSMRKLSEDCINSNFDVLTAQVRDGIESLKTTIRKSKS